MIKQQALLSLFKIESYIKANVDKLTALRLEKESSESSLASENENLTHLKARISELNLQTLSVESDLASVKSTMEKNDHKSSQICAKAKSDAKKCASLEQTLASIAEDIQKSVTFLTFCILGTNNCSSACRKRQIAIGSFSAGRDCQF